MNKEIMQQALTVLKAWDALIKHQYSGSSEAMTDMQYAAWHTVDVIKDIEAALAQLEQEPVAWMRMPKEGDRVVCIEDESLGTVKYLTAGGSPEIKFDDGSHGTYLLREFAELFRYADTALAQPKQEHIECGYDETVGMCTNNPCCEQAQPEQEPVSHLWECIGRWSSYLALNGEKANLAPPEWLVDAVKAATVQPEQSKYSDIVSDGGLDPRNKFDAQPEQESISTNDHLCAMLRQVHDVLACTALPMKRKWVGLTEEEIATIFFHFANKGVVELTRVIEANFKRKNGAI
jgi:hypothetical protein